MKTDIKDETKAELVAAARTAERSPGENEFWDEVERIWNADAKDSGLIERRETNAN